MHANLRHPSQQLTAMEQEEWDVHVLWYKHLEQVLPSFSESLLICHLGQLCQEGWPQILHQIHQRPLPQLLLQVPEHAYVLVCL